MSVSPVSPVSVPTPALKTNNQKQAAFSAVTVHNIMPEADRLIEHGVRIGKDIIPTVHPVIKRLPGQPQDGIIEQIISLTGSDVLTFKDKGGDMNALREIVGIAEKNHTIGHA